MKNQYFGDINDYRKYGLIRSILETSPLEIMVAWMLTPDDGSTDGQHTAYLDNPGKWHSYDPELFDTLGQILSDKNNRNISRIEQTDLLGSSGFYSSRVPDDALQRNRWFNVLVKASQNYDLVFLDPDNGIEIKSKPYGKKHSSKYLYWHEIRALWESGKSLLIYQHFIREKRNQFIRRLGAQLQEQTTGAIVSAFSTPRVVFFMALQEHHQCHHPGIIKKTGTSWKEQIQFCNLDEITR